MRFVTAEPGGVQLPWASKRGPQELAQEGRAAKLRRVTEAVAADAVTVVAWAFVRIVRVERKMVSRRLLENWVGRCIVDEL